MSLSLADFLLARIAEDEAKARQVQLGHVFDMGGKRLDEKVAHLRVRYAPEDGRSRFDYEASDDEHYMRWDPARVLADCEAKRKIVEAYREERVRRDIYQADGARAVEDEEQIRRRRSSAARCRGLEIAVEMLALPYADHPDYQEAWEPWT